MPPSPPPLPSGFAGRERGSAVVESIPGAAARITTIDAAGGIKVSETSRFRPFVVPTPREGERKRNPFAFVRSYEGPG